MFHVAAKTGHSMLYAHDKQGLLFNTVSEKQHFEYKIAMIITSWNRMRCGN